MSYLPLDEIYDEIMDHLKSSGDYDNIRMGLKDPIERAPDYQNIVERFKIECEKFCETVDLNQNRQALRKKLGIRFESYSKSRSELISLIRRSLEDRNDEIRSNYYEKARSFLQSMPLLDDIPTPADVAMSLDDPNEEVSLDDIPIPQENPNEDFSLDDIPIPLEEPNEEVSLDSIPIPQEDSNERVSLDDAPERPEEDDELERLTFSSVSSVKTADLSDFDNSIKLSDDEASIVGKPKNSKVPIKEIQDKITRKFNDLQTEVAEPAEASESDGGCSESTTTGRRVARTRKSNPRYSNEHYKLL